MQKFKALSTMRLAVIIAVLFLAPHAIAQQPAADHQAHQNSLVVQLQELQAKVARLEAALKQNHQAAANVPAQSGGAGGMGGGASPPGGEMGMKMDKMMGMMEKMMGGMGGGAIPAGAPMGGAAPGGGGGSMQPGQGAPAAGGMGMMEDDMGEMGSMQPGQGAPAAGGIF